MKDLFLRGLTLLSAVALVCVGMGFLGHTASLVFPAPEARETLLPDGIMPTAVAKQTAQAGVGDPDLTKRVLQEQRQQCEELGDVAYVPGSACDHIRVPCGVRKAWICPSLAALPEKREPKQVVIDWRSLVERYDGPWVHPK